MRKKGQYWVNYDFWRSRHQACNCAQARLRALSKAGQSRIFEDVTEAHTPVSEVSPTGVLCVFADMAKDLGCSTS